MQCINVTAGFKPPAVLKTMQRESAFHFYCPLFSYRVLIYQKRWVKLDAFYLRYFDNEKVRADTHV